MENLRRQLADDIDFEEKDAAVRSEAIKKRRLQEIEGNLKKLGCVGPGKSLFMFFCLIESRFLNIINIIFL